MTTTATLSELPKPRPRREILREDALSILAFVNALYEGTFGAACPGSGSASYVGHDHTPNGGGAPISRGVLWSEGFGTTHLYSVSFSAPGQTKDVLAAASLAKPGLFAYLESPGLRVGSLLEGYALIEAKDSDVFSLLIGDQSFDIPPASGEIALWVPFSIPVTGRSGRIDRTFSIRCGSYDSSTPPSAKVWGIYLYEPDEAAAQNGLPVTVGSSDIADAFDVLDNILASEEAFGDAFLLRVLHAALSGLSHAVTRGLSGSDCARHDHSSNGGRAVARNAQYIASSGDLPIYALSYSGSDAAGPSWVSLGRDVSGRAAAGIGLLRPRMTPGLASSGSPPSSAPYATVFVYLAGAAGDNVDLRVQELNGGAVSATTTIPAGSLNGWHTIDKVPISGGSLDEYDLQVRSVSGFDVETYQALCYEVPGVGGRVLASGLSAPPATR